MGILNIFHLLWCKVIIYISATVTPTVIFFQQIVDFLSRNFYFFNIIAKEIMLEDV